MPIRLIASVLLSILVAGAAALVAYSLLAPHERTYNLSATTEILELIVDDEEGVAAVLPVVSRVSQPQENLVRATFEAPHQARLRFMRKSSGDLFIEVTTEGQGEARLVTSAGDVIPVASGEGLRVRLSRPVEGAAPAPDTVLLAFRGELVVGSDVARLVETTLLDGRVTIVERQPFSEERFLLREAILEAGDQVVWRGADDQPVRSVAGFVQAGEGEALHIVAYAEAEHISVERFGARAYNVRPSVWDRLARDPAIAVIVIVFGFLSALAGLLEAGARMRRGGEKA